MKKKVCAFFLTVLLLCQVATIFAQAVPASNQLNQYSVALANVSPGTMRVTYSVFGMGQMAVIGAQKIVIEQQVSTGVWQKVTTFGTQYGYDSMYKGGNLTFSVIPGVVYRATLTAYAKDYNGDSDIGIVTSGSLRATV